MCGYLKTVILIIIMQGPLFSLWLLSLAPFAAGATFDQARILINDKLTNYTRMLRPRINQSKIVAVKVSAELMTVQHFDEVEGHLTVMMVFILQWKDEIMTWNPNDYGGIHNIEIDNELVWTPVIILLNSVATFQKVGDKTWTGVRYDAKGNALYSPGNMFSSKCSVDVTFYPWDRHVCELQFSAWGKHAFDATTDKLLKTYYTPNGMWEVADTAVVNYGRYTALYIFITLDRKPNFIVLNAILPIVFMAVMSVIVFLIPAESGERISYSITMLLAIAVFLTIVSENLPKVSNPMSYFSYYIVCIIIINMFAALANIFSMRIYHSDKQECIGRFLEGLTRCLVHKSKKGRQNAPQVSKEKNPVRDTVSDSKKTMVTRQKVDKAEMPNIGTDSVYVVKNVTEKNERFVRDQGFDQGHNQTFGKWLSGNRKATANSSGTKDQIKEIEKDFSSEVKVSWKDVSVMVDRVSFVFSMLAIIVSTTGFFIVVMNHYDIIGG